MSRFPQKSPRLSIGLAAGAIIVVTLLSIIVFAWLAWKFETLDRSFQDAILKWLFTLPLFLASALAVYIGVLSWRWLGVSSSIGKLMDIMRVMAEKRQGARATSMHYEVNTESTTNPVIEGEVIDMPALPPGIPTFAQLLDSGRIRPGMSKMILGFEPESGQEISGTWAQLFSCGIGGLQGSGKTWLAAGQLAQSALMGARLVICDPNPNDDESLSRRVAPLHPTFLCDIASDDRAILEALKLAKEKLERRKAGQAGRWDIVVAIDEWLALRRGPLADLLPLLVESFSTEGRKYAVNCMLMAQRWDKGIAGDFRNTLASSYIFRMRADEARMLSGMRAETMPKDTLELKPGHAYLLDTSGMCRKVIFPLITMDDMERVGLMVADMHRPGTQPIGFRLRAPAGITPSAQIDPDGNGTATGQQRDSKSKLLSKASGSQTALSPEAARAVDLFLAGERLPDIVRKVRNVDPAKGGRAGRQATDDVFEMIRNAMRGQS